MGRGYYLVSHRQSVRLKLHYYQKTLIVFVFYLSIRLSPRCTADLGYVREEDHRSCICWRIGRGEIKLTNDPVLYLSRTKWLCLVIIKCRERSSQEGWLGLTLWVSKIHHDIVSLVQQSVISTM